MRTQRDLAPMQRRLLDAIPPGRLVRAPEIAPAFPNLTLSTVYRHFDALEVRGLVERVWDLDHARAKLYRRTDGPKVGVDKPLHRQLGITRRDLARIERILQVAADTTVIVYVKRGTFGYAIAYPHVESRLRALQAFGKAEVVGYYRRRRGEPAEPVRDALIDDLRALDLLEAA